MNLTTILYTVLITTFLFKTFLTLLNLKSNLRPIDTTIENLYTKEKYKLSQSYLLHNSFISIISNFVNLTALIFFISLKGFHQLDLFLRKFELNQVNTGILFFTSLIILNYIVNLPFELYQTFVIEEKYGFNRTSKKTFFTDLLKSSLLLIIIGLPILAIILWFFESNPERGWLYAYLSFTGIQLLLTFLAPTVILPLFNKITPLPEGDLKTTLEQYLSQENFPYSNLYQMDGSKRSSKANAFFTGFGKLKKIVLFDTLIEKLSPEEIKTVLSHEMGHNKHKDTLKITLINILFTGTTFFILSLLINNPIIFTAFHMENLSIYASLLFFTILYSPLMLLLQPLILYHSRCCEYQADNFAVYSTQEPKTFISALQKITTDSLANINPHPMYTAFHSSHPPLIKRIDNINYIIKQ